MWKCRGALNFVKYSVRSQLRNILARCHYLAIFVKEHFLKFLLFSESSLIVQCQDHGIMIVIIIVNNLF